MNVSALPADGDYYWKRICHYALATKTADLTSFDVIFCRGNKSNSHSLAHFCHRKQKNLPLALHTCENFELDL